MEILLTSVGALLGGIFGHGSGAISGALLGWLAGRVAALSSEQRHMRAELAQLQRHLDNQAAPRSAAPPAKPLPSAPVLELSLGDLLREPARPAASPVEPLSGRKPPPAPPVKESTPTPPQAVGPSPVAEWLARLFSGENLLVKLGVAILFLGISFLVKYAAQRGLFPLELRLAAAAVVGCALTAAGWRLRTLRPVYAQAIQGGGVAIIYLTTYAAMRLYQLLPLSAGFSLLVLVCGLTGFLAVAQDSRTLAVLGSAGGFLAPELAAIGSGSHVTLFAYYGVLNLGILGIARYRTWRELHLVGFVGTFIVGALWGWRFYRPEYFVSVEPFLILYFLIYTLLPVWEAANKETARLDGFVDVGLVFGTPIMAFAFQHALVHGFAYGLAGSSLTLGAFYLLLARRLVRNEWVRQRQLAEAFLALGTLFATLAIPLALDGRWTAAAWSVEGTALLWAGLRQQRLLPRLAGYLLIFGSGFAFIATMGLASGPWPVANGLFVGCLLEAAAGCVAARLLAGQQETLPEAERFMEPILLGWGVVWWFGGGLHEIAVHTVSGQLFGAQLLFVTLSCLAGELLRQRLPWQLLALPALGLLPAIGLFALVQLVDAVPYPSLHGGWYAWPAALGGWYLIVRRRDDEATLHPLTHAAPLWLLILLAGWELSGRLLHHFPGMATWALCTRGALPALVLLLLSRYGERLQWPVARHRPVYLGWGALPLAVAALCWLLSAQLTQPGDPAPLPWLPLFNPLDGVTLLVLVSLAAWQRELPGVVPSLAAILPERSVRGAGAAIVFIWLNAMLLRSIHHWGGVPFTIAGLFSSLTVQTALAIFWSLLALGSMTLATRRGLREIWLAGAGLLGAVVVKLFLVDLAGHGSVARIVSFVVVGLLILLMGWYAPVPPRSPAGRVS